MNNIDNEGTVCTLTDLELIDACLEWNSKLAKSGGKAWCLQVPVHFDKDPDILFNEIIKRFKQTLNNE